MSAKMIFLILITACLYLAFRYAEKFALNCLAHSVHRIRWIDRLSRIAFLLSDVCLVVLAAMIAYTVASAFDLAFIFSVQTVRP